MWTVEHQRVSPTTTRLVVLRAGDKATLEGFWAGLRSDEGLRELLVEQLAALPFDAFFWETPPVTNATAKQPFECVVIDAPGLATRAADSGAFDEHLRGAAPDQGVVTFDNLGGDASLVVPTRQAETQVYAHLASFVRGAPRAQRGRLFEAVGEAVGGRIGDAPLWVSTAGMGVPWLHVRLDSRPKYYRFEAYRSVGQLP